MIHKEDYAYDKPESEQVDSSGKPIENEQDNEQDELEAISFCDPRKALFKSYSDTCALLID